MTPDILVSRTFNEHPAAEEIKRKVRLAFPFFPEITDDLTIIRFGHSKMGSNWATAYADFRKKEIGFNVKCDISMNTIFHELGHFLQRYDKTMPSGEQACSIYALARMPESWIDSECIPYIGLVPRCRVGDYCRQALEYKKTHRNYIKWLRAQLLADYEDGVWPKYDTFDSRIKSEQSEKHYEQLTV